MTIPIVYLAAGLSKRFGERPKQLAKIGPRGETLIEYSVDQAIGAGFDEIIFITGQKTHKPINEIFSSSYKGVRVKYAMQPFNSEERDNPWGECRSIMCSKK